MIKYAICSNLTSSLTVFIHTLVFIVCSLSSRSSLISLIDILTVTLSEAFTKGRAIVPYFWYLFNRYRTKFTSADGLQNDNSIFKYVLSWIPLILWYIVKTPVILLYSNSSEVGSYLYFICWMHFRHSLHISWLTWDRSSVFFILDKEVCGITWHNKITCIQSQTTVWNIK